jgi:hypothetical protein
MRMSFSYSLLAVIAAFGIALAAMLFSVWHGEMTVNTALLGLLILGEGKYIEYLIEEKHK